jgi:hypothetical protein
VIRKIVVASLFIVPAARGPLAISFVRSVRTVLAASLLPAALFLSMAAPRVAQAQQQQQQQRPLAGPPVPGLEQNDVDVLRARGDSLLIGPCFNLTTDGGASFQRLAPDEDLCGEDPPSALFSLDVEGDVLAAGLGRSAPGGVSAAAGFLLSRNGGASFVYRSPQLDSGTEDTVRYGINVLPSLPVVVPAESAPVAVDYVDSEPGALWVAGRASGLRRLDGLADSTFERLVLPPDTLDAISPIQLYRFPLRPKRGEGGPGFFNHIVSSVLVDETGTVWAGTSAGVNRSRPADVFVFERESGARFTERAWRRFGFDNTNPAGPEGAPDTLGDGLSGNFVPRLVEQPLAGRRNPVWMVTQTTVFAEEERGATFTRDGGETFEQTLLGEDLNDFAFRGETVYAASERGLFISEARTDSGYTWRLENNFPGADVPQAAVANRRPVRSVATTEAALWAGTEDGLLRSADGGATWQVFRARVPTDPEEATERVPRVETYAYPNPFSPVAAPAGVVRIVAEAEAGATATVQLYDFAMDFVRELTGDCDMGGRCEVAWDGTGADGARVANGVYFYEIEADSDTARGKIMVLE